MTAMQTGSSLPPRIDRLAAMVLGPAAGALGLTLLMAAGLATPLGVSPLLAIALAFVPAILGLLVHHASSSAPFGLANAVTLVRASLAAALLSPIVHDLRVEPSWTLVLTALLLLALDGLDGWIARRRGETSAFGARFDMEADALLLTVLALLAVASGRADAWVLLAPALRPLFVLAGRISPRLTAPLPSSGRRKICCVVSLLVLIAALAPPIGEPFAALLALVAVLVLGWSFAADLRWLTGRRRVGPAP